MPKSGKAGLDMSWIGVDLDGTLAEYHGWSPHIGKPIGPMRERVLNWLAEGKIVKIMTARGSGANVAHKMDQYAKIRQWCLMHLGQELEITNEKNIHMDALYDDRAVGVEFNTGRLLSPPLLER